MNNIAFTLDFIARQAKEIGYPLEDSWNQTEVLAMYWKLCEICRTNIGIAQNPETEEEEEENKKKFAARRKVEALRDCCKNYLFPPPRYFR